MLVAELEITGFAVFWDQNGTPILVESEGLPASGRKIEPDERVMRQAQAMLRQLKTGLDSSSPHAA
jgi:hypothetical protein